MIDSLNEKHLPEQHDSMKDIISVFISYDEEDKTVAEKLYTDLLNKGIKPFIRDNDILPGKNVAQTIATAIREADFFLALISESSLKKGKKPIWKELKIALENRDEFAQDKIFIIPVRINNCIINDPKLTELQSADLFPSYKEGFTKILKVLKPAEAAQPLFSVKPFISDSDIFVDRSQEMSAACDENAIPYILFESPPGYGKTKLLHAILNEHYRNGWICVYMDIPEHATSVVEIAQYISVQAGYSGIEPHIVDPGAIGLVVAGLLKNRVTSANAPGAILLIDSIEHLTGNEIDAFINQFLSAAHQTFNFRVRLARRYSVSSWKEHSKLFHVTILRPLTFKDVKDIVNLSCKEQMDVELLSAHLMHATGGHPHIITHLLSNRLAFSDFLKLSSILENEEVHKTVVNTARQIREAIPDSLKDAFDILCFFRRFNFRLLKKIVESGLIKHEKGADGFERDLTSTYLVKRKDGFLQDIVSRHLLYIRLFLEDPVRFFSLCENAGKIYEEDLKESANARAEFIAIEGILNELQFAYYRGVKDDANRTDINKRFFGEQGILSKYLNIIGNRSDVFDIKGDLITFLEEKSDQEFEYFINFYLRGNVFNSAPYETMINTVKEYFAHNTGVNHA